jgi:hypothetical protein
VAFEGIGLKGFHFIQVHGRYLTCLCLQIEMICGVRHQDPKNAPLNVSQACEHIFEGCFLVCTANSTEEPWAAGEGRSKIRSRIT